MVDMVVPRQEMRAKLALALRLLHEARSLMQSRYP